MNRTKQTTRRTPRKAQYIVVVPAAATLLSLHGNSRADAYTELNRRQRQLTAPPGAKVQWYGSDGHLYNDIVDSCDDPFELTPEQAISLAALSYQEGRDAQ